MWKPRADLSGRGCLRTVVRRGMERTTGIEPMQQGLEGQRCATHMPANWCRSEGLNPAPSAYRAAALPDELDRLNQKARREPGLLSGHISPAIICLISFFAFDNRFL